MSRALKPQPHAIDLIRPFKWKQYVDKAYDRIVAVRPRARRFIFDSEASAHVGHFIRECGDMLLANRQFALPPFPTTYVQCDIRTLVKAIGRPSSADIWGAEQMDSHVGYLIDGDRVNQVCQDAHKPEALISMFEYRLNTPAGTGPIFAKPIGGRNPFDTGPDKGGDPFDEVYRLALLLGSTYGDMPDDATAQDIVHNIHIGVNFPPSFIDARKQTHFIACCAGDMRNMLAMLLLLNQKRHLSTETVSHSVGLLRGKRHVFAAHTNVRIHLTQTESTRRAFLPTLHVPRRAHDVAAHFAHWHLQEGCEHQWPIVPDVDENGTPRWTCARCKGLRVRRRAHVRGHGGVGVVTKDYSVTK